MYALQGDEAFDRMTLGTGILPDETFTTFGFCFPKLESLFY